MPAIGNFISIVSRRGGYFIIPAPFSSDMLFFLNGTIIDIEGDKYFEDKTANNRHFLITDYDFNSNWISGFPYKSSSTISAPIGDAVLIAADVNNFLYTADGTPNPIPVVSLFQDIDYEHKLFCRHIIQAIDGNGVETTEPNIVDIVLYDTVKSGADLITCQTYFGVPEEDASAIWITKSGDDTTGDGSKVSPWLTLTKARAANHGTVYVKSGIYEEVGTSGYLYFSNTMNVVGIGLCELRQFGWNMVVYFVGAGAKGLKGFIINAEGVDYNIQTYTDVNVVLIERCKLIGAATREISYTDSDSANIKFKDCVINTTASYVSYITCPIEFTGSYIKCTTGYGIYVPYIIGTGAIKFTYNKTLSGSSVDFIQLSRLDQFSLDFRFNKCESTLGGIIRCDNQLSANVSYNVLKIGSLATYALNYSKLDATTQVDEVKVSYNHISSLREDGFTVLIGADGVTLTVNKITSIEVIGNNVWGPKYFNPALWPSRHGLLVGYNNNAIIKYNNVNGCGIGILKKHNGEIDTNGVVMYNTLRNCVSGIYMKGQAGEKIYNNTVSVNFNNMFWGIRLSENSAEDTADSCVLRNNILFNELYNGDYGLIYSDAGSAVGLDSDYNLICSKTATFANDGSDIAVNLTEWKALGYDTHSVDSDPLLDAENKLPDNSLLFGIGAVLDAAYDDGLDESTDFSSVTETPSIVTKQQGELWDIGAYVR